MVGGDGEADGADTSVEVKNVVGGNVTFYLGKGHFVDGEVDLEEAVRGVRVSAAQDGVCKMGKGGVWLMVFIEATLNFTRLITPEKEGLVATSLVMVLI